MHEIFCKYISVVNSPSMNVFMLTLMPVFWTYVVKRCRYSPYWHSMVQLTLVKTRRFLGKTYRSERTTLAINILPSDQSEENSHLDYTIALSWYSNNKHKNVKKEKKIPCAALQNHRTAELGISL